MMVKPRADNAQREATWTADAPFRCDGDISSNNVMAAHDQASDLRSGTRPRTRSCACPAATLMRAGTRFETAHTQGYAWYVPEGLRPDLFVSSIAPDGICENLSGTSEPIPRYAHSLTKGWIASRSPQQHLTSSIRPSGLS